MDFLFDPNLWIAFAMLTALEIVLGVDNIIFISILVGRLPAHMRDQARRLGLGFAMISRLLLLFSLSWVMSLTTDLFNVVGQGISGRDLVLLFGGLFLLWKASHEIFVEVEASEQQGPPAADAVQLKAAGRKLFWGVIGQIAIIDIVFSLDSVITAVGMVDQISVMVAAVVTSVAVMMVAAKPIGEFVDRHPSVKVLALALILVMVGMAAHRRSLRCGDSQGLHLRRDGVLAGGRGAQHPRPRQAPGADPRGRSDFSTHLSRSNPFTQGNTMNPQFSTPVSTYGGGSTAVAQRNKVLRNTYWLLALSMVPTVLGAWIGVTTGLARAMSPGIGLIVFMAGAFGFMFAIEKTKNSAAGVPMLLAFTFFMGVMLSRLVGSVLGLANGAEPDHDRLRRHRGYLPGHGDAVVGDQARPQLDGQIPVHRRDHAAGGGHREHLPAVERVDDHAGRAGHRHLLGVHPL